MRGCVRGRQGAAHPQLLLLVPKARWSVFSLPVCCSRCGLARPLDAPAHVLPCEARARLCCCEVTEGPMCGLPGTAAAPGAGTTVSSVGISVAAQRPAGFQVGAPSLPCGPHLLHSDLSNRALSPDRATPGCHVHGLQPLPPPVHLLRPSPAILAWRSIKVSHSVASWVSHSPALTRLLPRPPGPPGRPPRPCGLLHFPFPTAEATCAPGSPTTPCSCCQKFPP